MSYVSVVSCVNVRDALCGNAWGGKMSKKTFVRISSSDKTCTECKRGIGKGQLVEAKDGKFKHIKCEK